MQNARHEQKGVAPPCYRYNYGDRLLLRPLLADLSPRTILGTLQLSAQAIGELLAVIHVRADDTVAEALSVAASFCLGSFIAGERGNGAKREDFGRPRSYFA